jgi:hypothetical protein
MRTVKNYFDHLLVIFYRIKKNARYNGPARILVCNTISYQVCKIITVIVPTPASYIKQQTPYITVIVSKCI